jgi:Acetyltransferase (GNAT) domain
MNQFRVLEIDDPEWNRLVNSACRYDFHHTADYHRLENAGRSVLCVASSADGFVAMPLVIRPIPASDYLDCTSVYGYCGPIASDISARIPASLLACFREAIQHFLHENRIVTAFSRLHPLIDSDLLLEGLGEVLDVNKTVYVDLHTPPEQQVAGYRKSNKTEIKQLKSAGYETVLASTDADIDSFIDLYEETMDRVNAAARYYYSRNYYTDFIRSTGFESLLLLARLNGKTAAGAIFTITSDVMQYHLAATANTFMRATPMKLLLDEARLLANQRGLKYLHLGGGVGGSDDDSLFLFKSGFAKSTGMFKVWRMVVDQQKYAECNRQTGADPDSSYFPLYRSQQRT